MATYNYTQKSTDGFIIKYNITPSFSTVLNNNATVTITGQISNTKFAINKISAMLVTDYNGGSYRINEWSINKNVAKGATATFTITGTVSYTRNSNNVRFLVNDNPNSDMYQKGILGVRFSIYNTNNGDYDTTEPNFNTQAYTGKIASFMTPTISLESITDNFKLRDGVRTPIGVYGGYIQGKSNLIMQVSFDIDTHYYVRVELSGGSINGTIFRTLTCNYYGDRLVKTFDFGLIDFYGDITYTLHIEGLYRGHDSRVSTTGTIHVYQYTDPQLSELELVRYIEVLTDGVTQYVQDDEGTQLWINATGYVSPITGLIEDGQGNYALNPWKIDITYHSDTSQDTTIQNALSGSNGGAISVVEDRNVVPGNTFVANENWFFTAVITDEIVAPVTVTCMVDKAGAIFDVEKYGVAVGMRSSGVQGNKKFEVADDHTTLFYGDVFAKENKLLKVVTVSDNGSMGTGTTTMTKTINVDSTVIGDGWTAIGVVGHRASNSNCVIYRATIDGTNATLACRYNGTSSGTTITLYADILCLHTISN